VQTIFSFHVEDIFKITNRKGMTLIGTSEGFIKNGDFLIDKDSKRKFKVIGVEMIDFIDIGKSLTHNPALIINAEYNEALELKGKTLVSI
jgi:hypothetical protein